jgi:hypothetical protein
MPLLPSQPPGTPQIFGGYAVFPHDECAIRLYELYRSVSQHPEGDVFVELCAIKTHHLITQYVYASYYVPFQKSRHWKRYPPPAIVYRRMEAAIRSNNGTAWHRCWYALSPRGKRLFDVAFRREFRRQGWPLDPYLPLFDARHPWRAPLLGVGAAPLIISPPPPPSQVLLAALNRTIDWNSRRTRPPATEQDEAAVAVLEAFFLLTGERPREPSTTRGTSERHGSMVTFVSAVEGIYGVPLLRVNSGAAWARVLKKVPSQVSFY